jgi:hypothetical protein
MHKRKVPDISCRTETVAVATGKIDVSVLLRNEDGVKSRELKREFMFSRRSFYSENSTWLNTRVLQMEKASTSKSDSSLVLSIQQ